MGSINTSIIAISKRMAKLASVYAMVPCAVTMTSCEKDIDIDYHDISPLPVIEATISQEGTRVSITYTTPMDEPMDTEHIKDATVLLSDMTSGTQSILNADSEGYFRDTTPGIENHEYKLSVSISGKEYVAYSKMLPSVEIESMKFYWVRMPGDDMAVLQIRFTDSSITNDYYWIRVYRNGEPYTWSLTSDNGAVNGIIETVITTTHRDTSQEEDKNQIIIDGDTITAEIYHISREMCDYLVAIQNGNNGSRNFQGSECLGYFLASPYAMTSVIFYPDKIDYAK